MQILVGNQCCRIHLIEHNSKNILIYTTYGYIINISIYGMFGHVISHAKVLCLGVCLKKKKKKLFEATGVLCMLCQ
jgi:hypothetical protein